MKALMGIGIVLLFIALLLAGLALGALIIMVLGNVVLNHFDLEPLTYGVSFAIAVLIWAIGVMLNMFKN